MKTPIKRKCHLSKDKNKTSVIYSTIHYGECMKDAQFGSPIHTFLNFAVIKATALNLIYIDNRMDDMGDISIPVLGGFKTMDLVIEKMEFFIANYKNLNDVNIDNYKEQLAACNYGTSYPMILSIDSYPDTVYEELGGKQPFWFVVINLESINRYSLDEVKTILKELTKFRSDAYAVFKPMLDKMKYKPTFNKNKK